MTEIDIRSNSGARLRIFRDAPDWEGMRAAALGELRIDDAEAGAELLQGVAAELKTEGFDALLGPMDGDTWRRHRVVVESDGSAPFVMEPTSGPHDLTCLENAGFAAISHYVSARAPVAAPDAVDLPEAEIEIRAWDGKDAERLISSLFEMSLSTFAHNAFYKPIDKAGFLAMYAPILPALDPRLVLFAHDAHGELVGFLFGLPDFLAPEGARGAILKTYASRAHGAGHRLAHRFHLVARDLGYASVIHALMHVDNASRDRSGRHAGKVFRRYALMGRKL